MTSNEAPNMNNIMKAAQAMQEKMQIIQQELANTEVIGQSQNSEIEITMTGRYVTKQVHLNPMVLTYSKGIVEDLLLNAINDAHRKAEKLSQEKLSLLSKSMEPTE